MIVIPLVFHIASCVGYDVDCTFLGPAVVCFLGAGWQGAYSCHYKIKFKVFNLIFGGSVGYCQVPVAGKFCEFCFFV